ncbi:MAG TPA: SpoIIE family protein phosphatase, partial [Herpetosiphonaceae bacterium]|nr:SpoIIE family protein phosphatase [Herpetosiphonaceae bacterium]
MPFEIQIAVAKTNKYASRDSGDTVELVERPAGGLSVVLIDGQGSGQAAKTLSLLVSAKAVSLLKDGARDGAVARAVHDYLHTFRHGRVSATLEILSVDLVSKTVIASRNSDTPLLLGRDGAYRLLPSSSGPIGIRRHTKPTIDQF